MIDVKEHVYDDDPQAGPPDVRTELKGVDYFFIGNGLIQAAIQTAPAGDGTPIGLLIMNPELLRKKREALTMDGQTGLAQTMLRIKHGAESHQPRPGAVAVSWSSQRPIPTVCVRWRNKSLSVEEYFYCPNRSEAMVLREVRVKNLKRRKVKVEIQTGLRQTNLAKAISLNSGEEKRLFIRYSLNAAKNEVYVDFKRKSGVDSETIAHWKNMSRISFVHPLLDHYFRASKFQLPAVISRRGRVDGGVWQYNREWLRDQAMVALALTMTGEQALARTMFNRLFDKFVTVEGDTIDSSETRDPDEIELDQNGFLLYAFKDYVLWTGDLDLARRKWDKLVVTAEFPLKDIFRHQPSGLLANRREFWERHRAHGIDPGIELVHQVYTSVGLSAAAVLARMLGHRRHAVRWEGEAFRIKQAALEDPVFRLTDKRGFIKRRRTDGSVQEKIEARPDSGLPQEAPLAKPGDHFLNPDTSAALPIALGFIPPHSPLGRRTLASLETLWNQSWKGGGYGRYHASSEPDSPGGWPFPSLFVARASVEMERTDHVWRVLNWLAAVPGARAGSWFEFYGKRLAPPFPQVGIVPWNWAEMVILFVYHILGVQPQEIGLRLRPRLLPGLKKIQASFPFQKGRFDLEIRNLPKGAPAKFRTNSRILQSGPGEILVAYPGRDLWIKAGPPKIADRACHREERSDVAISTEDSYFGDCHAPKGRSQ